METKELLRIIKACRANGVDEFALGELKISFSQDTHTINQIPKNKREKNIKESPQMDLLTDEANQTDSFQLTKDEIENLILENPLEYERLLEAGDLVDDPRLQH